MTVSRLPRIPRPQRLSEEVGAVLGERIWSGAFAPGERLPTEARLSEEFAVSRAVVREAIARLKADGLVESRQGAGAFVVRRPGAGVFRMERSMGGAGVTGEIFELRLIIEVAAAERAALRHTPVQLKAMAAALARMEEAVACGEDGASFDDDFHCAIAEASGNPLIGRFVAFVSQEFSASRAPTWSADGVIRGLARAAQDEHRAVFEAIASGDAEAAGQAAHQHLINAAGRLGVAVPTPPATGVQHVDKGMA